MVFYFTKKIINFTTKLLLILAVGIPISFSQVTKKEGQTKCRTNIISRANQRLVAYKNAILDKFKKDQKAATESSEVKVQLKRLEVTKPDTENTNENKKYNFDYIPEEFSKPENIGTSKAVKENPSEYSLRYTGEETVGPNGGRLYAVEIRDEWKSNKKAPRDEFDRGKMSWVSELFGEKAAEFAGFGKKSATERWDPDAEALNGAKDFINAVVTNENDKIAISWYEAPESQISPREYVAKFSFHQALPKAAPGSTSLHDGNFHWAASALPPFWVRLKAAQGRAVLRFEQFLKNNKLGKISNKYGVTFEYLQRNLISEINGEIDNLTGRVMTNMNPSIGEKVSYGSEKYGIHAYNGLRFGYSPEKIIRETYLNGHMPQELIDAIEAFIEYQKQVDPDFSLSLWEDPELSPFEKNKLGAMEKMNEIMERRIMMLRENIEKAADAAIIR